MFNKSINFSTNLLIDLVIKSGIGLALLLLIAPLKWFISEGDTAIPITFGSLLACLIPAVFGWRSGSFSVFLYLILGACGFPVFAGYNGGLHYFIPTIKNGFSLSTGFLYGFLMASLVVGFMAEKLHAKQMFKILGVYFLGQAIILTSGFYHISNIPNKPFNLIHALKSLLPGLLIKAGIFMIVIQMLDRKLNATKNGEEIKEIK